MVCKGIRMELFTVVLLTYQQRHHLNECLKHIFLQDYEAVELIVCDNNSCDFSVEEVEAYIAKHKPEQIVSVQVYQQPDYAGEAENCKKALELSHGVYVTFLKVDEEFADKKALSKTAAYFAQTNANVLISKIQKISEDGKQKWEIRPFDQELYRFEKASPDWLFREFGTLPSEPFVCEVPVVFRTEYIKQLGFDPAYASVPFWTLWLKLCEAQEKAVFFDQITMYRRMYVIEDDMAYMAYGMKERHYEDCIRLLQDYVYPRLARFSGMDRLRCRHAVEVIKIRIDDRKWYTWKFWKKCFWKIRKMPTLMLASLYRIRNGNYEIHIHNEKKLLVVFSLLFYLNISVFPGRDCKVLWAAGAAATFALFTVKQMLRLCISMARAVLDKKLQEKW